MKHIKTGNTISTKQRNQLTDVLLNYKQAFARHEYDIGEFNGHVPRVIDTKDEQPIRSQPFRVPHIQKQALDTKVNKLINHGILGPTVSPWSSPSILVPRVNEPNDPRFVSDFRKVNAITVPLHWPLPRSSRCSHRCFSRMQIFQ